jgi:competence protein ComEA
VQIDWELFRKYGLAIVALIVGIIGWFWLQKPSESAFPNPKPTISQDTPLASASVTVYVSGRVVHPGVVELKVGSRVIDAIKATGGMTIQNPDVNLARVLVDGEQIVVAKAKPQSSAVVNGKINLNSADQTQLETIPGIGPVMAQRILDFRNQNGRFRNLAEVDAISGIGPSLLGEIQKVAVVE